MYFAMCEEVQNVEEALCDVRDMIQDQHIATVKTAAPESLQSTWQVEWTETVQRVASANAGWAWHGFWKMILRNLREPPCGVSARKSMLL